MRQKLFTHDPSNPNSLLDNRVSALLEDQEGRVWAGTYQSGLYYFDPKKETFIRMMPDPANPNSMYAPQSKEAIWGNNPFVSILQQKKKGGYWMGTIGKGINHFDGDTGKLTFYNPDNLNRWAFHEDRQGQLWLGNIGEGLYKMDVLG